MEYGEFVQLVQSRAGIASFEEAENVGKKEHAGYATADLHVRAAISVPVEVVSSEAIRNAIAGLPKEMRIPFEKALAAPHAGAI